MAEAELWLTEVKCASGPARGDKVVSMKLGVGIQGFGERDPPGPGGPGGVQGRGKIVI